MPDIQQLTSDLRQVPDQALQSELQSPTGLVPSYLVLAEAQRRQLMRQAQQKQQSQGDSSTVLQDVVRNMMSQQPPPGVVPAGMAQKGQPPTPGQQPTPTPPQPPQPPGRPPGMAAGGPIRFDQGGPTPDDITGWINKYADQYGVDPETARSIMMQESSGNPAAIGPLTRHGQAIGLFQLMPYTAHEVGVDPRDPESNVKGGINYYSNMLARYNGNRELALAAYNAGPRWVDKFKGIPPFLQTQRYVPQVIARADKFAQQKLDSQLTADRSADQMNPAMRGPNYQPQPASFQQAQQQDAGVSNVQTATATPATPVTPSFDVFNQADPNNPVGIQGSMPYVGPRPDDTGTTFATTATGRLPGPIHQLIDAQDKAIADINNRITNLDDPYGEKNVANVRKMLPSLLGVDPNYLATLGQSADTRAATINQLQQEILNRYHNPSPWEFLANIAGGMGASKSLNLASAFGQGVASAWQQRDAQQQQAISDYDALEKMRQGVYSNVATERGRFDQMLTGLLEHQATISEQNRKVLTDQLSRATAEKDKLNQMLIPTNKLQALYNPADYPTMSKQDALNALQEAHAGTWNKDRVEKEWTAVQLLAQRGDKYTPGESQYPSAADQFVAKYPEEATELLKKPSKYSPADIATLVNTVHSTPEALFDPKNVPKDAQTEVRAGLAAAGFPIPTRPPNKTLHDSAAMADRTLSHLQRVEMMASDPWMQNNIFGPFVGRAAEGQANVGMDQLGWDGKGIPKDATPQQTADAQNLLTSIKYLYMLEGKGLLGGRPAERLMQDLKQSSPNVTQTTNRFIGALQAVKATANMAKQNDYAYMFNKDPITAVPVGARVGTDNKSGRQVVQMHPGEPWYYMDTSEEWKKP